MLHAGEQESVGSYRAWLHSAHVRSSDGRAARPSKNPLGPERERERKSSQLSQLSKLVDRDPRARRLDVSIDAGKDAKPRADSIASLHARGDREPSSLGRSYADVHTGPAGPDVLQRDTQAGGELEAAEREGSTAAQRRFDAADPGRGVGLVTRPHGLL